MESKEIRPKGFSHTGGNRNIMFIVKERYPLNYHWSDYSELVPALHDTFFQEKNGQIYAQFSQGQLISKEVFDLVFGKQPQPVEVKPQETIVEEVVAVAEVIQEVDEVEPEVEVETELEVEEVEEVLEVKQPVKEEEPQSKSKSKKKK